MSQEIVKNENLALDIRNLTVQYVVDGDVVEAVNDVSLQLENGKTLGLVGETGAGKTSTALAILNMIPDPPGIIKNGEILESTAGTGTLHTPVAESTENAVRRRTVLKT